MHTLNYTFCVLPFSLTTVNATIDCMVEGDFVSLSSTQEIGGVPLYGLICSGECVSCYLVSANLVLREGSGKTKRTLTLREEGMRLSGTYLAASGGGSLLSKPVAL